MDLSDYVMDGKAIEPDSRKNAWAHSKLLSVALLWSKRMRKKLGFACERSEWWLFIPEWDRLIDRWLDDFKAGRHRFSPIRKYRLQKGIGWAWQYLDRLVIHWILTIIRPTFKHIISPLCLHLAGPSSIKGATTRIKAALNSGRYNYCLRIDIRSYYASINHRLLINQLTKNFDDPIIGQYLADIVTIGVDRDGQVFLPTQGIPTQSALSPFFGALYLSALDQAFTKRKGVFYLRFMDDIIILIETRRQYAKARKRLFAILKELRLQVSPRKTRMGGIQKGFHFLGVKFEVTRIPQKKNQVAVVSVHARTPHRALDKVVSLSSYAVHPAIIQRYLVRWAAWWHQTVGVSKQDLIFLWICCTAKGFPDYIWIGRGLLAFDKSWQRR